MRTWSLVFLVVVADALAPLAGPRTIWAEVWEHALSPRAFSLAAAAVPNAAIPAAGGRSIGAYVARPDDDAETPRPLLVLVHEARPRSVSLSRASRD